MEAALDQLKQAVCDAGERRSISDADLHDFAANCIVALPVGGEGSRLRSLTDQLGVQKSALRLPNGVSLIEHTILMYREAGFRKFVALVFHRAHSIVDILGDGSSLGVQIAYSQDPEMPVGRGGAIRHALENGSIDHGKSLIVHNPDDVIAQYEGSFPRDAVAAHLAGLEVGTLATAIMVEGVRAPYTGMRLQQGMVVETRAYPFVPIPAHIGVTVFSPTVYPLFENLFDLTKKSDFEGVLFPLLASRNQLYATLIPTESCYQVNDPKSLDNLVHSFRDATECHDATTT